MVASAKIAIVRMPVNNKIDLCDMLDCLTNSPHQNERAVIDSFAGILLPGCGGVEFSFKEDTTFFSKKHKGISLHIKLRGDAPSYTVSDLRCIVADIMERFPNDQYATVLCHTPGGYAGPLGGMLSFEECREPGHFFLHGSAMKMSSYTGADYVPA